jgi:hypothetical protein
MLLQKQRETPHHHRGVVVLFSCLAFFLNHCWRSQALATSWSSHDVRCPCNVHAPRCPTMRSSNDVGGT